MPTNTRLVIGSATPLPPTPLPQTHRPKAPSIVTVSTVHEVVTTVAESSARAGDAWMGAPRLMDEWSTAPDFPRAACVKADPELFFPPAGGGNRAHVAEAKAVCRSCDDRTACLSWALENKPYGVWGGLTEKERREYGRRVPVRVCLEDGCYTAVTLPPGAGRIPLRCDVHRRVR